MSFLFFFKWPLKLSISSENYIFLRPSVTIRYLTTNTKQNSFRRRDSKYFRPVLSPILTALAVTSEITKTSSINALPRVWEAKDIIQVCLSTKCSRNGIQASIYFLRICIWKNFKHAASLHLSLFSCIA